MNTNWVLLLLLIFAGQTISVPIVNHHDCESDHSSSITSTLDSSVNSEQSMMHHDMSSMPSHDMSDMYMMDMSADSTMDCCGDECQCVDGLCLTTVYMTKLENKLSLFSESTVHFYPSQFSNIQRSSSFYRPPIFS